MVHHLIEPFNLDVIKVTIKDKPGLREATLPRKEESLRKVLEALKEFAEEQRKIKDLQASINKRNSNRQLRYFFKLWYSLNIGRTQRAIEFNSKGITEKMSNDKKIELLISSIAEKQMEARCGNGTVPFREENGIDVKNREKQQAQKEKSNPTMNLSQTKNYGNKTRLQFGEKKQQLQHACPVAAKNRVESQSIIKEQRAKLAEQRKFIQDLQLRQIDKETKETSKQTIHVVKKTMSNCDQRTRRSLIHLMRVEGCRDKSLIEFSRIPSPPRCFMNLEARAAARKQRMKEFEEIRQRKREEEARRQEISRREAEEEQYRQQMQAFKAFRKQRKEHEERRLKVLEKNKRMEMLADQFYKKYLFRRYAIEPLSNLLEERHNHLKKADQFYEETLALKMFSGWKSEWIEQQQIKLQLAKKRYRQNLLGNAFNHWKIFALNIKQKFQVAVDFYDMKIQLKYFQTWHQVYSNYKNIIKRKEIKAVEHYEKCIKMKHIDTWKKYMLIADDIRERENRRDEWRDLIKKFIPDSPKLRNFTLNK